LVERQERELQQAAHRTELRFLADEGGAGFLSRPACPTINGKPKLLTLPARQQFLETVVGKVIASSSHHYPCKKLDSIQSKRVRAEAEGTSTMVIPMSFDSDASRSKPEGKRLS
jgi:hypothetical protein